MYKRHWDDIELELVSVACTGNASPSVRFCIITHDVRQLQQMCINTNLNVT